MGGGRRTMDGGRGTLVVLVVVSQLLISSGEAGQPPKISEHPVDSVVPRNEPVTLNCKAEGDPPPTISWTKDGRPLTQISDSRQLRFPLPSGSLFFLRVRSQDSGVYACRAVNSYGQVTSRDATLEVATLREDFRISPQNTWIAQGETATLDCEPPRGNPEPKVFWKKNGQVIDVKGAGRFSVLGLGSLSISDVREDDEGNYVCVAKSIVGLRQSNPAHLRVIVRPQFTIVPANTSALLGSDVSLVCVARGDPPPEISWNKERGSLPLKRARFDEERFLISNVSAEDAGVYRCIAENKAGSIVSAATITILSPPFLTIKPNDLELQPNATAVFECVAQGDPHPTLFWSKEGSHSVVFQGTSSHNLHVGQDGTLKIDSVSERDEGFWFCAAVSYAGSVMHKVHLKVTPIEDLPPPIILAGAGNETRSLGGVAVLPCRAEGSPLPVITWYKDSNSFPLNHRVFTDATGTLRINDLTLEDAGMYECVASSRSGKYVWRSFLTVTSQNTPNFNPNFPGSSNGDILRPSPMKPHIVKVDSTSVTIAWHPKYFSIEPNSAEPRVTIKTQPKSEKRISEKIEPMLRDEPMEDMDLKIGAKFSSENPNSRNLNLKEPPKEDEDDNDYEEALGQFETGVEKLREMEDEDEDDGGYNLIIQSRPRTNSNQTTNESPTNFFKFPESTASDFQLSSPPSLLPATFSGRGNSIRRITFNVEYYSAQEVKSEWLLGATVSVETATLQYLKPNAEYLFFVRSVSADGILSPPSPLSDPVTTTTFSTRQSAGDDVSKAREQLESPVVVLLKTAYATSSTSVKLEWQVVTSGDFIEGFYIYFRPIQTGTDVDTEEDDGKTLGYQMLTVLNTGAFTFQITGLDKHKPYQIFLIPFYKNVDGRPSNYLNVTTAQDVPSVAPEIRETLQVNGSALVVRWAPPPPRYHHGLILGYQLRVWSGPQLVGNRTTDAQTSSIVLGNLTPGQSYSLQIGAFTSKGSGTFSSMKTVHFKHQQGESKNESGFPTGKKSQPEVKVIAETNENKIYFGKIDYPEEEKAANEESNEVDVYNVQRGSSRDLEHGQGHRQGHSDNPNEFLTEAWFIALIGSVIFLMLLVFVFALYMRRCQLRNDMDKLRVSTTEIPDGSMPPHYPDDNLWIDSQQTKQLSIKCGKSNDLNEYENGNNYAVVEDRHSPIAYATTTLVNGEKHKSNFGVFGEPGKCLSLLGGESGGMLTTHLASRPTGFGLVAPSKLGGWNSNVGTTSSATGIHPSLNSKTASLSSSQDVKREIGKGTSLNVLSTFQTPLPGRKQMVVDLSSGGQHSVKSSILKYHEPRLNLHLQQPTSKVTNYPQLHSHSGYSSNTSSHF